MAEDVRNYVQKCITCKECKAVNYSTRPEMGKFVEVKRPFQQLYIDFLGKYPRSKSGNSFLLIVLDKFSRFVFLKPLKQSTATHLVEFLEKQVFNLFSVPETVFTDNGKQFVSHIFQNLLEKYGVRHIRTPKYSPQSNASERVNRTLLASIRAYILKSHREWDLHIDEIASALRNVVHASTNYSPHFAVFGEHKINHGSDYALFRLLDVEGENHVAFDSKPDRLRVVQNKILQHLKEAYERSAKRYNLRSRNRSFTPGEKVLVKNFTLSDASKDHSSKLARQAIKAQILKPVGNVAYEVVDENQRSLGVYHLKDIRKL